MAFTTTTKPGFHLPTFLARPFVATFNVLVAMAEAHPRMAQINRLNALSDAELAARGTTRADEVRRIFPHHY